MKQKTESTQSMMIKELMEEMIEHEGYVSSIYRDSLGFKTVGVGHLVVYGDPEYLMEEGAEVDEARIAMYFYRDVAIAIEACFEHIPNFDTHPKAVQEVLINMMFNLGRPRLMRFKNMMAALNKRDYITAASEMVDSKWYGQVKRRAVDLVAKMRSAA